MTSLGLPAPQRIIGDRGDLGIVSGIKQGVRENIQLNLANQKLDQGQQALDIQTKKVEGSAMARLLKINEERRLGVKSTMEEAKVLKEQLLNLPEADAIEVAKTLYDDPKKKEAALVLAPTPELLVKRIRTEGLKEGAKAKQTELKFKADLTKSFDNVDEFIKTEDVTKLTPKKDRQKLDIDAATEVTKSLRQTHRVQTNALLKQFDFTANAEQKQTILDQINTLNESLIEKTKLLFSDALKDITKDVPGAPVVQNKDEIFNQILDSVSQFANVAELEADLASQETKDAFKNLGIDIVKARTLLVDQFNLFKDLDAEIATISNINPATPGGNVQ